MIQDHFTNGWGQEWLLGDWVIQGIWYEKLRSRSRSYFLLENSPCAFVYSHLIIVSKFRMPPTTYNVRGSNATYELTFEVIGIIRQGLEAHMLVDINED
jgi:hypothetical protein